jgi:hypothetical protein
VCQAVAKMADSQAAAAARREALLEVVAGAAAVVQVAQKEARTVEVTSAEAMVTAHGVVGPVVDMLAAEYTAEAMTVREVVMAMADTWAAAPMEVATTEVAMSVEASAVEKAAVVKVAVADTSQSQGCCTHPSGSCELSSSMMRLQISRESYSRCAALP